MRLPDRRGRIVLVASIALGLIALAVFFHRLGFPEHMYWDEIFYVPDGRAFFRSGALMTNPEHPPLGKFLIGLGLELFGDQPVNARVAPVLAMVALIAALPILIDRLQLTRAGTPALLVLPSLLLVFDPLMFATARLATLDAMLVAAYVFAALALIASLREDRRSLRVIAGLVLGLALAIKWTSITLVPLVIAFGCVRILPNNRGFAFEWKKLIEYLAPALALYACSFLLPGALEFTDTAFHISQGPMEDGPWIERFFVVHWRAVRTHTSMYTSAWRSHWYEWLMCRQAFWYFTAPEPDGSLRAIIGLGSPVFWCAGAIACLACVSTGIRESDRITLLLGLTPIAQLAFWAGLPRMAFIYYMTAILPFYALAITRALSSLTKRTAIAIATALAATSLAWFLFVYPLVTGEKLEPARQATYLEGPFAPIFLHSRVPFEMLLEDAAAPTTP